MNIPVPKHFRVLWAGVFLLGFCSTGFAQNLIPNPSFESFNNYKTPYYYFPYEGFPGVQDWYRHTKHNGLIWSDSIRKTIPADKQFYRPFHGQAYARLCLWNTNFGPYYKATIQAELNDSLQAGCYYSFTMYVLPEAIYPIEPDPYDPNSASANYGSTKNLGAYFSKQAIFDTISPTGHSFDSVDIRPQVKVPQDSFITDTTNYTRVSGIFRAEGGEKYVTLGYFGWVDTMTIYKFHDQQTHGSNDQWRLIMMVDSINLYRISPPGTLLTSSRDTSMCSGDSLQLFTQAHGATSISWDDGSTDSLRTITQPGTYWVDAFYPCGDVLSDTIVVTPRDELPAISLKDTTICEDESVLYTLPPGPAYQLNGNSIGNSFSVTDEGQYLLRAINSCESQDFTFEVTYKPVDDLPQISIKDTALCEGEEMRVNLPGGFIYTLNDIPLGDSLLVVNEQNQYILEADNSCEKRSYPFTVNDEGCEMQLYIPNAFTPDGDGLNDRFELSISEYESFHIVIFNRWGEMIFESRDPHHSWNGAVDGQKVAGSYTYVVRADDGNRVHTRHGVVSVLR